MKFDIIRMVRSLKDQKDLVFTVALNGKFHTRVVRDHHTWVYSFETDGSRLYPQLFIKDRGIIAACEEYLEAHKGQLNNREAS